MLTLATIVKRSELSPHRISQNTLRLVPSHSSNTTPCLKSTFFDTERLAQFHGSQCGFCTPGIVVACHATLVRAAQKGTAATPDDLATGLDGNLCRCTGYRPILDACKVQTDKSLHVGFNFIADTNRIQQIAPVRIFPLEILIMHITVLITPLLRF